MHNKEFWTLVFGKRIKDKAFVQGLEDNWDKLRTSDMEPYRRYALYCAYEVSGVRKMRVLKRGLPWDEARDLQVSLQDRRERMEKVITGRSFYSSWGGRYYGIEMEPVIGEVPVPSRYADLCEEMAARHSWWRTGEVLQSNGCS